MIKYLLSSIILLSSFSLSAQDSPGPTMIRTTQETPKIKSIRKMLELTGSGKLGIQVMQNIINTFKSTYSNVSATFWDDFMKEVTPDDLVNLVIPIYDRNFTAEEIDGMVAFYSSPLGQKVLSKMPQVMQECMQVGKTWGEELGKKVIQKLQQKGYIKEG